MQSQSSYQTTRMGFEPTTSAVTGRRSNQLSHQANKSSTNLLSIKKWTLGDSNPGPTGYEPVALTNWAKGPNLKKTLFSDKADDRTRTDNLLITNQLLCQLSHIGILNLNDSNGNRTRVTAVKGRCLNRLTMEPNLLFRIIWPKFLRNFGQAPRVGLEPTTTRLTAERSTDWAIEE